MDTNAKTIFIVDDDDVISTIADLGLKRAGFNTVKCSSGMACLESLMYYMPDIILAITDDRKDVMPNSLII